MYISNEVYSWLHANEKNVLEDLEAHIESLGTASIDSIQNNLSSIMSEMQKSDFRGLTSGKDEDYDNALDHVRSAHISLGIAKVKLNE